MLMMLRCVLSANPGVCSQVHVTIKQDGTSDLFLDTRDLIINSVTEHSTGKELAFKFAEEHKASYPTYTQLLLAVFS